MNQNIRKDNKPTSNKAEIKSKKSRNSKTEYLYGMTIEQYKEGLEIHSKCFESVEEMTLTLIIQECLL